MNILKRLTQRERLIVYFLIATVTLALSYNFLIEPVFKYWQATDREIDLIKGKLQKSLLIIKKKEDIDTEYALYAEKMRLKGSGEQELTDMLNAVEVIARSSRLKIINMKPKPPQDREFYKRFIVEIDSESDMGSLMKFIYDVKSSPLLLKVDKLTLNAKRSQTATVVIRASLVISKIALQ